MQQANYFQIIQKLSVKIPSELKKSNFEDLCNDFFLKVIHEKKFQKLSGSQLYSYMYISLKNFIYDDLKKNNKLIYIHDYAAYQAQENISMHVDEEKIAQKVLQLLPLAKQEVLIELFMNQKKFHEYAQKKGCLVNEVGVYKTRALKALKKELKKININSYEDLTSYFNPIAA